MITKRQYSNQCYSSFNGYYDCNGSNWGNWGRWVFLALAILFIFLICVSISCFSARRRRRLGRQPYYGTGWANRGPWAGNSNQPPVQNNPNTYYAHQQPRYEQAAPPYDANQHHPGSYGRDQQHSGIELAAPGNTYGGYEAPAGPPPKKY